MTRNPLGDIRAALDTLMANRTSIIIAHRLSTERNTDTILVMEAGRVIETGNHADLLTAHGAYAIGGGGGRRPSASPAPPQGSRPSEPAADIRLVRPGRLKWKT